MTTVASMREGPQSALVPLGFILLAGSSLRPCRSVVIANRFLVCSSYFAPLIHAKRQRPELAVSHPEIALTLVCFAFTPVLAGQSIRQARRLVYGHPVPVGETCWWAARQVPPVVQPRLAGNTRSTAILSR